MSTFQDLGLNPMIVQALTDIGFEKPTPIQGQAIPHLINSERDLVALARTGTGKTAAFSLPIIEKINSDDNDLQALMLSPTRELAIQIAKDIQTYLKYLPGIKVQAVYGGERIDHQIRALKKRPQIVVGTPGRVYDLLRRKVLKPQNLKWLVLDEADEMLNMGFKEELDNIISKLPEKKQVLLFSATMNKSIRGIARNYMVKPEDIKIENAEAENANVQHYYYVVNERDRYQALRRIADLNPDIYGIVFCRTRRDTQKVADRLIADNYSAEAIHGEISQSQRIHVMNRFRDKQTQILVATDVAARGIDVDNLTHVINYNPPESAEIYVHRSGRTGRAHNSGVSLMIINKREHYKVKQIERQSNKVFEQAKIPSAEDICQNQLFSLVDKVQNVDVNEEEIQKYLPLIQEKLQDMDRDELIKKFFSVEFNRFIQHYQDAEDLNAKASKSSSNDNSRSNYTFSRIKINIGKKQGVNIKSLFKFINSFKSLKGVEVGNITIKELFTLIDLAESYEKAALDEINGISLDGLTLEAKVVEQGIKSDFGGKRRKPRGRRRKRR